MCFVGCQSNKSTDSNIDTIASDFNETESLAIHEVPQSFTVVENQILFPSTYRNPEINDLEEVLNKGLWFELYEQDKQYHIAEARYKIKHIEEDPCSGFPAQQILSDRNALLYFNIPTIPNGKVDSIAFSKNIVFPGEPLEFMFNEDKYRLEASGITFFSNNNPDANDGRYILKLYINNDKEGKILVDQSEYNDSATEILFMGDLDKDGKVDFIFSSPRDYEEDRVLIILSESMMIYEGTRQFDC